jgi:hypothetical protein
MYRAVGTLARPQGIYRAGLHIAHWPAGVPALPHNTSRVVAAWEAQQGTRRPLTREEVLEVLR